MGLRNSYDGKKIGLQASHIIRFYMIDIGSIKVYVF